MTLDPVFRSRAAVRQIQEDGFLDRMATSLAAHREAVRHIHGLLPDVLGERYRREPSADPESLSFLQNHFFLVLFHSIFETLGPTPERLTFYARLNFCIKGIVTAGDNLFDDEAKLLLPLALESGGTRFESILQLLCFDRLAHRLCDDAVDAGSLDRRRAALIHRGLLDRLAHIGTLEGSEEAGVQKILTVDEMLERVHRVRGGALFSLAFIAPCVLEEGAIGDKFEQADHAIRRLGTAFQIVDDLTDFEFDLKRRSHNILVAEAYHGGDERARATIQELLDGRTPEPGTVEGVLAGPARRLLDIARSEGQAAFVELARLGFWLPPDRSAALVHAIVGIEGVTRMESLTDS